jgi:hypothetical protein
MTTKKVNKHNSQEKRKSTKTKLVEEKREVLPNSSLPDNIDLDNKIKELKHVRKWTFIGFAAIITIWAIFFICSIMYLNENLKDDVEFFKTNVCISKTDFDKLFKSSGQLNEYDGTITIYDNFDNYETLE